MLINQALKLKLIEFKYTSTICNNRDLQIRLRLRLRVRVRLLSARGLGRRHCCYRRQLATKIFQ